MNFRGHYKTNFGLGRLASAMGIFAVIVTLAAPHAFGADSKKSDDKTSKEEKGHGKSAVKGKRRFLKLEQVVPIAQCEDDPASCLCPHNSRGLRFRGSHDQLVFSCVTSKCPPGKN